MWKTMGGVVVGVFVGAVICELSHRHNLGGKLIDTTRSLADKLRATSRDAADAFQEGYGGRADEGASADS